MFLQVHYLTPYHASLLNRDDAGLAKRITFGGVPRLRVSSQCQKKHWRDWLSSTWERPGAIRSRHVFSRVLLPALLEQGVEEEKARELVRHFAKKLLHAAGGGDAVDKETLDLKQPLLFGRPETRFFTQLLVDAAAEDIEKAKEKVDDALKNGRNNWKALLREAGIDDPFAGIEGALFGRFVTSDIVARVDAPVHVAHAFTTHELDTEVDFFTVVDDLSSEEETGAAHANEMELGAGVFYGYVVVDIPLLVSNLSGFERERWREADLDDAREVLAKLLVAIAQVTPGAKLGATAPYSRAEFVLLQAGTEQPFSLANAFLRPVRHAGADSLVQASVKALADHLERIDGMYGAGDARRWVATIHDWPLAAPGPVSFPDAVSGALDAIFGEH